MPPHQLREPCLLRWSVVIQHLGGGCILYAHDDDFFKWWERQIITIDDYPYEGIKFSHDPDMHVPPGGVLGEIGKKFFQFSRLFNFYFVLIILKQKYFCYGLKLTKLCECADIGPRWPEGYPHHRHRGCGEAQPGADAAQMEHTLQNVQVEPGPPYTTDSHGADQGPARADATTSRRCTMGMGMDCFNI
jgi:hypothetical protein